jgi:hypothetical protein
LTCEIEMPITQSKQDAGSGSTQVSGPIAIIADQVMGKRAPTVNIAVGAFCVYVVFG